MDNLRAQHDRGECATPCPFWHPKHDVEVSNHGSVFLFALLTEAARDWVRENVSEEHMMFGSSLAVEPRFALDLANGMKESGLKVA